MSNGTTHAKRSTHWPRVNDEPFQPGCYVEGSWGQYGPDHLADRMESFGFDIAPDDDPRVWRRLADLYEARGDNDRAFTAWESHCEYSDGLLDTLNAATTGGYWDWRDGEVFLLSYVCQECGRDGSPDSDEAENRAPCDYCHDAEWWEGPRPCKGTVTTKYGRLGGAYVATCDRCAYVCAYWEDGDTFDHEPVAR